MKHCTGTFVYTFRSMYLDCHSICLHVLLSLETYSFSVITPTGRSSVPEIFFNNRLIGGLDELEQLDKEGKLDAQIQECLQGPDVDFPPPYRKPKSEEFLKVTT